MSPPDAPDGFRPLPGAGAFLEHVGPVFVRDGEAGPVIGMRVDERHLNVAGTVHGGLLATLVDFALGRAVRAGRDDEGGAATVSLTVDYLSGVSAGDWVEAHTEVERLGGTLAFADCSVRAAGREVVRGRAVFAVLD